MANLTKRLHIFVTGGTVFFTSFSLTQDGLDSHPQVPPNIALFIDYGNPVDQWYWVHQIGQIYHSSSNQAKPINKILH